MEAANLSGISDKDQNVRLFPFLLFLPFLCIRLYPRPCQPLRTTERRIESRSSTPECPVFSIIAVFPSSSTRPPGSVSFYSGLLARCCNCSAPNRGVIFPISEPRLTDPRLDPGRSPNARIRGYSFFTNCFLAGDRTAEKRSFRNKSSRTRVSLSKTTRRRATFKQSDIGVHRGSKYFQRPEENTRRDRD